MQSPSARIAVEGCSDWTIRNRVKTWSALGMGHELHRLALNLMENAVRHTPPGTTIRAGVERENGSAVLTVEDDGPGIDPVLRDRVFERFVRGSGDSGRSFGLGLSIVRAVAESHGGTVRVESPTTTGASIARGTRFVVTLPVATREPAPTT